MAEALINHLCSDRYIAFSAGSKPTGVIHPRTIEILKRYDLKTESLRSKSWSEFENQQFDLVITVCNDANTCPYFSKTPHRLHWEIADPATVLGQESKIKDAFENTFHQLRNFIERLV